MTLRRVLLSLIFSRSTRNLPHLASSSLGKSDIVLSGHLHTRAARPDDLVGVEDDQDFTSIDDCETQFYQSLSRNADHTARAPIKTYGRSTRKRKSDVGTPTVFSVGDTVVVKTMKPSNSIGVITAIWKAEGEELQKEELRVQVHWFLRPEELPKFRVKREFVENEVLYTLTASAITPPSAVLSHCTVTSSASASVSPKKLKEPNLNEVEPADTFFCRLSINQQGGIYCELHWGDFRDGAMRALSERDENQSEVPWPNEDIWTVKPGKGRGVKRDSDGRESPAKRRRVASRKAAQSDSEDESSADSGDEFEAPPVDEESEEEMDVDASSDDEEAENADADISFDEPKPPRKRKRGGGVPRAPRTPRTPRTPRRPRADKTSLAQPTPHSKAALRRRKKTALAVRPPPPAEGTLELALARGLKGGAWLQAMHVPHVAARPGALPCREEEYGRVLRAVDELLEEGSGGCICKTATVHAVVRELKHMAKQNEANPFAYVEINGLKIPEPAVAYGLLWEAVCGHDTAKDGHMKISSKEALRNLSQHFSGTQRAGPAGGHACVVLIDELDQLMTTNQDVVYNLYNWPTLANSKLVVLAVANTMDLPERVMTGRVRSRLGMVRINFQPYTTPQLEQIVKARLAASKAGLPANTPDVLAVDAVRFASMKVSSISGNARRVLDICRRTVELEVIKDMQNSPTAAYLRELSFHERLMLAALIKCVRKEGVEEIKWSELQHQHIVYVNLLANDAEGDPSRRPSSDELVLVLNALLASHALICEDGAAVARKAEDERRVALNLEYVEIERVLGEIGGPRWRNALNV
ncbi:hypothetical protein L227DRAFT_589631 [Lentinus tigrinus ALCF2SS1-6]|uniref:Origin recognition complex subunit 1 n=1 Tax=Lentinus tigrinus ALCF2SS1-6 TaxID=1328759 RepID=A0A5C2RM47_9APHY|nr:hypothetical protein L227DRAFT_589631 [Lentinus tigrinus ALCF2SS1-6]